MVQSPLVFFVFSAFALLVSCTPRADIMPKPAPDSIGTDVSVLVGSTRKKTDVGGFSSTERGPIFYSSVAVSIPPEHAPGEVEVGGKNPDPEKYFLTRSIQPLSASGFRAEVARRLAANPGYNGEAFVFIHGFNNTAGDGVFRTAQIASDLNLHALPVHYAWPSSGRPLGYPFDRDSALFARTGLEDLIDELSSAGVRNIILIAHSLGSNVTMETLRKMALTGRGRSWNRIGGVALMAPDIDVDLFHAQVADIGELPQPFLIFSSQRDRALRLSARLTGQKSRLGNIDSASEIAALDITVINVSGFTDTRNVHLTAVTSPTLIKLASETNAMDRAFQSGASVRTGLLPGTILTVQNATEIILDPVGARLAAER